MREQLRHCACVLLAVLCGGPAVHAVQRGVETREFRGTVVVIDQTAGAVTVNGENVDGWMPAMTMAYRLDKPDRLAELKAGDRITATIRDRDFSTLYDLRIVASRPAPADPGLPALSYVCLSPGEESFVDDKPGTCPNSGAALIPRRFVTAFACLFELSVVRDSPGTCPADNKPLVPINAGLYFTCRRDPRVHEMTPGKCADGSPRVKALERVPHGDHNPRYGGMLLMASDFWHHVEGTYLAPDRFRLYLYDDFTQPMRASGTKAFVSRTDANGTPVGESVPMVPGPDGRSLEAPLVSATPPLNLKVRVLFKPDGPSHVFDFVFPGYSKGR